VSLKDKFSIFHQSSCRICRSQSLRLKKKNCPLVCSLSFLSILLGGLSSSEAFVMAPKCYAMHQLIAQALFNYVSAFSHWSLSLQAPAPPRYKPGLIVHKWPINPHLSRGPQGSHRSFLFMLGESLVCLPKIALSASGSAPRWAGHPLRSPRSAPGAIASSRLLPAPFPLLSFFSLLGRRGPLPQAHFHSLPSAFHARPSACRSRRSFHSPSPFAPGFRLSSILQFSRAPLGPFTQPIIQPFDPFRYFHSSKLSQAPPGSFIITGFPQPLPGCHSSSHFLIRRRYLVAGSPSFPFRQPLSRTTECVSELRASHASPSPFMAVVRALHRARQRGMQYLLSP